MSNNGINSATNGRTSANNTHATATSNTNTSSSTAAAAAKNSQTGNITTTNNATINTTLNNAKTSISFKTTALPDKQQQLQQPHQPKTNNNEHHQHHHVNTGTATGTATSSSASLRQPIANVNINTTKIQTHRRDSSTVSGHHNSHTSGIHLPQSLKDASKYRYIQPQTLYRNDNNQTNQDEVDKVEIDPNHDHCLVYYDDQLIAGSLDALIEHMVPTSEYYPERTYTFSFLLSVRLFIRPHELLAKISQTWEQQQQQLLQQQSGTAQDQVDDAGHFTNLCATQAGINNSPLLQRKPGQLATQTQKSAQNCIRLLAEWIETFPYDFRDERLMQQVRILTRKCVYIDNALGKQVSRILQLLVQRLTALEKYEEFLQSLLQNDLNTIIQPHYSTSASASYSSSSSSTSSSNAAHNSLTKSSVQALNSHHDHGSSTQKNHYLLNAQFSHISTSTPASYTTSSNTGGHSSSDSPNSHDIFSIMDLCPSCAQLAHQLTAIELERLSHIGPEEFVQAFAKEYQNSMSKNVSSSSSSAATSGGSSAQQQIMQTSLNDMKKTRNLESYVEWFNRLSYLTASEIVKYPKKKQRVRIIEYWIETARECFNIGNFNSLMAIIAGLNLAPISRLKKTWSKIQSAKFSVLEHQMDPTSNFNSYRSTLKAAMWRSEGATEERERIIIPFFSLFVKDLYFLNEGCSNRLPNNHINFEKCSQLAKQVMEFNEWKKVTCPFEKLPNVISYLQNSPVLNENTLSMASFECEPPENTEEKDRYKTVKAETKQQLLQQLQEQQLQQH
ncbi:ras-GEF domain-containing family member 1B [Lucilia sericata]|uniref:ras-GEF domain-containing family member 1B n=1 Tax=Lucilia sericata TaxID=13632 RepID=UPI0018A7EC80|nr:ras-GEF domain-containing family member 1B [Lucilia sericata]XP_037823940.1 ras-GEF domain-containing family member 1B [Lucilia sericata]